MRSSSCNGRCPPSQSPSRLLNGFIEWAHAKYTKYTLRVKILFASTVFLLGLKSFRKHFTCFWITTDSRTGHCKRNFTYPHTPTHIHLLTYPFCAREYYNAEVHGGPTTVESGLQATRVAAGRTVIGQLIGTGPWEYRRSDISQAPSISFPPSPARKPRCSLPTGRPCASLFVSGLRSEYFSLPRSTLAGSGCNQPSDIPEIQFTNLLFAPRCLGSSSSERRVWEV